MIIFLLQLPMQFLRRFKRAQFSIPSKWPLPGPAIRIVSKFLFLKHPSTDVAVAKLDVVAQLPKGQFARLLDLAGADPRPGDMCVVGGGCRIRYLARWDGMHLQRACSLRSFSRR
jgi:hypothetical protein